MFAKVTTWLKTELPLVSGGTQGLVALLITVGGLSAKQAGVVEAAIAAVLAVVVAAGTKHFTAAGIAGAVQAIGVLLVTFKVAHVSAGTVSAADAFVAAILALLVKQHIIATATNLHVRVMSASHVPPDDTLITK